MSSSSSSSSVSDSEQEVKKVKFGDWMGDHTDDEQEVQEAFSREQFDAGSKGHLLLQL
jgi:hypothetical protein